MSRYPKKASITVNSTAAAVPARTRVAWLIWTVGVAAYILTVMQRTTLAAAGLDAADRFGLSPGTLAAFVFIQVAVFSASADPGWTAGGPVRAASDARRQRGPAGQRADPAGARDNHARRRCGASSGRDRRCDRLRGDLGAHPTMVFATTGAVDDPADNNRRSTGADSVCRPVRRIAPPQRMVDRIHQRRRRQCADGRAGIRGRAQRSARILGADSDRVGPRRRRLHSKRCGHAQGHVWASSVTWPRSSR